MRHQSAEHTAGCARADMVTFDQDDGQSLFACKARCPKANDSATDNRKVKRAVFLSDGLSPLGGPSMKRATQSTPSIQSSFMALFDPRNKHASQKHQKIHAAYAIAETFVSFSAAMLFLVGSWMFFYKDLQVPAIWCFVIGSVFFAIKPTLRLIREIQYALTGDLDDLVGS
ncbi:YrhK family protein [Notoacmeibacter ruber]|nr:YrhK family protein [Notoacmeibacter ruber]